MVQNRDIPVLIRGGQEDYRRLYKSNPEAALTLPVTISAGWGLLKQGQAIAVNESAAGSVGKYQPYDPTAVPTGALNAPARKFLVANSGTANAIIDIGLNDSYAFIVGDDLFIIDDTTAAENLGAIVSIDRTTYRNFARIVVTTNVGGTSFTTARFAYVTTEGYNTAVGILEKSVDTGSDRNASGAWASLILSNALLYTGILNNVDAAALTDLSASKIGLYTKIT